ncbi:MAG: hypothetical protein AB7I59_24390 [Geminicoccaceae bacterium]
MTNPLLVVGAATALAATVPVLPASATQQTAVNVRLIQDGCDVGGRGNDIQSIQSHYEPGRDRIVVTLRLCDEARPKATYRLHLDHAAPFVGGARTPAGCVSMADTVVAQTPTGHRGIGTSRIEGSTVRFVVPLGKLDVGKPKDQPLIALWATSSLGSTEDRAPNRETGDGCAEPRAATETLVQGRVAITGGIAFVSSATFTGAIGPAAGYAMTIADAACQAAAIGAGYTDTDGIHAWLTNLTRNPASLITAPGFGPIQKPDGTLIAATISNFQLCDPISGNQCLANAIDTDINGNLITNNFVWTATVPNGTNPGGELSDCDAWTSAAAGDTGDGGTPVETNAGFTTGVFDNCNNVHPVLCVQFE